jgi:hypothetical protein
MGQDGGRVNGWVVKKSKRERASFLKKRSKKLLVMGGFGAFAEAIRRQGTFRFGKVVDARIRRHDEREGKMLGVRRSRSQKSFLLLFFKKEALAFYLTSARYLAGDAPTQRLKARLKALSSE